MFLFTDAHGFEKAAVAVRMVAATQVFPACCACLVVSVASMDAPDAGSAWVWRSEHSRFGGGSRLVGRWTVGGRRWVARWCCPWLACPRFTSTRRLQSWRTSTVRTLLHRCAAAPSRADPAPRRHVPTPRQPRANPVPRRHVPTPRLDRGLAWPRPRVRSVAWSAGSMACALPTYRYPVTQRRALAPWPDTVQ